MPSGKENTTLDQLLSLWAEFWTAEHNGQLDFLAYTEKVLKEKLGESHHLLTTKPYLSLKDPTETDFHIIREASQDSLKAAILV